MVSSTIRPRISLCAVISVSTDPGKIAACCNHDRLDWMRRGPTSTTERYSGGPGGLEINERAGKANDMDTDDKTASQADMRLGPLRHFLIKTVIVACAVVITGWIIFDFLGDFVDRRIERALRSATSIGGTQFWTKVEKQLDQLADPKSDIPPEKKQKILTQIKIISDRWRPFLLAATASGDPDAPTR